MVSRSEHPHPRSLLLAELCESYGVQLGYRDMRGTWQESPRESLVVVLRALGADLGHAHRVGERALASAAARRRRELENQVIEPVLVAWDGKLAPPEARVPGLRGRAPQSGARLTLTLEDGTETTWDIPGAAADGAHLGPARRPWPRRARRLPYGYHRLVVDMGSSVAEATVISAPRKCWAPESDSSGASAHTSAAASKTSRTGPLAVFEGRPWGLFAPLYALHSDGDWGAGDLTELAKLRDWVAHQGGCAVSTLPLLSMSFDEPFDPSPYRPVSRLFWNEFYLAVEQIPEWRRCAAAREAWGAVDTRTRITALRASPLVDYQGVIAVKREILERLAECFFREPGPGRREAFERYLRAHPDAEEYARFRAGHEGHPSAEDAGAAERYHLFCQWQMDEQLSRLSDGDGPGLMLDLPLGVHPYGFDVWRWPELFAGGMSTGAPPDDFFARGQDWAAPPLHPLHARREGHQYFARCIRAHMRQARYLRVDHVMSLHRLFWVPQDEEPAGGVYVSYPAEELYAVLSLESHRNRSEVVGEDLGTVPREVRAGMRRHGLLRTWVLQLALRPRAAVPVGKAPSAAVAGLNTHDMVPFAGFLRGEDIEARVATGQLAEQPVRREHSARGLLVTRLAAYLGSPPPEAGHSTADLLLRVLALLAASPARLVLVDLADLLLETRPQNLPGTGVEWDNWRRKAPATLSEATPEVATEAGSSVSEES